MNKFKGTIARGEMDGHRLLLQEYAGFVYLRVEDGWGCGILKVRMSLAGDILPNLGEAPPETDFDLKCVDWARGQINA